MVNKIIIFIAIIFLAACTCAKKKPSDDSAPNYIMVDAKVKVYHNDGTRSYKDYQPFKTRTVDLLKGYHTPKKLPDLSKYGGILEKKTEATGYFYTKKIGKRWFLVDPDGYLFIKKGLAATRIARGESSNSAFAQNFESDKDWANKTSSMLREYGFNGTGAFSNYGLFCRGSG